MATRMTRNKMKSKGVTSLREWRGICMQCEVRFITCQMTVDRFDLNPE